MTSNPRALLVMGSLLMGSAVVGCTSLRLEEWRHGSATATASRGMPASARTAPEILWQVQVEALPAGEGAVFGGGYALVATVRGHLLALDAQTGARRGRVRVGRSLVGAPALTGNLAVLAIGDADGALVAYDVTTGRTRWKRDLPAIDAAPRVVGEIILIADRGGTVSASSITDGGEIWTTRVDTTAGFLALPVPVDDAVLVADDRGTVALLAVHDGSIRWRSAMPQGVLRTPSAGAGVAVAPLARGSVCAVTLEDGTTAWCHDLPAALARPTSPAVAGSVAVLGATDGLLTALDLPTGAVLWTHRAPAGIAAAPVVVDDLVLAGDLRGNLRAVRLRDGELIWTRDVGGRIEAIGTDGISLLVTVAPRNVVALGWPE